MLEITFIFLILLLVLSGLFSGSESALFSLTIPQREHIRKLALSKVNKKAKLVFSWIKKPEKTLSLILLGNISANIIFTELSHRSISLFYGAEEQNILLYSLIGVTLCLLIFGEIIPKVIAMRMAVSWSLGWASFLRVWFFIAGLLTMPFINLSLKFGNRFKKKKPLMTQQELMEAVEMADNQGILPDEEEVLLKRSILYYHDTAYNAMLPRAEFFMMSHITSVAKARKFFNESNHSFAIIYHEKDQEIIGVLQARSLVLLVLNKKRSLRNAVRSMAHVPETMPISEVLEFFIKTRTEFATVNDESGNVSGVVTLKNILSRLMAKDTSSMKKEYDNIKPLSRSGEKIYRISGSTSLIEFNEYFDMTIEAENSETISGYILEQVDGFPREDSVIHFDGFELYDVKVENYKIENFLLRFIEIKND